MNQTQSGGENREAEDDFKIFDLSNRKDGVGIYQMKKTEIKIGKKTGYVDFGMTLRLSSIAM